MFQEFPKIARLSRECVITEKIDGTNAQVEIIRPEITEDIYNLAPHAIAADRDRGLVMYAGSRTRYITPENDNHGFAAWVKANADALWALGEGRHYGEWWGSGIQRGYGLPKGEKRFSLFNTARWADERDREKYPQDRPACCYVVPVISSPDCTFDNVDWRATMAQLAHMGSLAAPGFMKPEGIVIYHVQSGTYFKKTLEKDAEGKEQKARRIAHERRVEAQDAANTTA